MTLVVRNEADILGANLDYHPNQGVDHVLVTDHGCSRAKLALETRDFRRCAK